MTHIDLLIVIVAALLVFELRRRLGRSGRRGSGEKPVSGGLDGYLRSLRDRRTADEFTPPTQEVPKIKGSKPLVPVADLPFEEVFVTVRDSQDAKPAPPEELSAEEKTILQPLREHQPNFRLREFMGGARYAYEAIVEGFAANDFNTLDELLSEPARGVFFGRMKERRGDKNWRAANLVSIEEAKVVETRVEQGVAFVAVRFVSEQFESLRSSKRAPLRGVETARAGRGGGSPEAGKGETSTSDTGPLVRVRELWTFRRVLDSSDPNWTVSAVAA